MKIGELEIDAPQNIKIHLRDVEMTTDDLEGIRKTIEKVSADQVESAKAYSQRQ